MPCSNMEIDDVAAAGLLWSCDLRYNNPYTKKISFNTLVPPTEIRARSSNEQTSNQRLPINAITAVHFSNTLYFDSFSDLFEKRTLIGKL